MMPDLSLPAGWLPVVFMTVMGVAVLVYVLLDGYDLGIGILLGLAPDDERDRMVASIGPFWDANETWLVLGIGVLLTAFPHAHGVVMHALYLPVALMLLGLILRGVAFDFRFKAIARHRQRWNGAFCAGSLLAAAAQGVMLGRLLSGFSATPGAWAFAAFTGLCLPAAYALLGAGWLLIKTDGTLQRRAVRWARVSLALTAFGMLGVSLATPLMSRDIFEKWFVFPELFLLAPLPVFSLVAVVLAVRVLGRLPAQLAVGNERWRAMPFALAAAIFVFAFMGLEYSLFPWIVPGRIDLWQAAAAPESLALILVGVVVVLPLIIAYTAFAYWVFRGKSGDLTYS